MKKKVIEIQVQSYEKLEKALQEQIAETETLRYQNQKLKETLRNRCGAERPYRKTICQLPKDHDGSHQAVIFWEDEVSVCSEVKKE